MTRLLFIRHGESMANGKGFFAGQLDIELSKKGMAQAELLAEWICKNYSVDKTKIVPCICKALSFSDFGLKPILNMLQ